MNSQTPQQLVARRERLKQLAREIDDELTAIEGALGVYGARRSGRPRTVNLLTDEEALAGHRQYIRTHKRRSRRQEAE